MNSGEASAALWLELRRQALARADALGLPTTAHEDWRYVRVEPLARVPTATSRSIGAVDVTPHLLGHDVVVLVDGVVRTGLGSSDFAPGLAVEDLFRMSQDQASLLADRWRTQLAASDDVTACWTLADLAGGIRLRVDRPVSRPLHVLSLATGGASGARIVIELAKATSLHVILTHVGLAPSRSSIAVETEIGAGARLCIDEVQHDDESAGLHLHRHAASTIARDGALIWTTLASGGDLVRFRGDTALLGGGSEATLAGLAVLDGDRQAHQHLRVRHVVGDNRSTQRFRNVADGRSTASFDGLVAIAKGADRANAEQENKNLLLTRTARIDTRPQLDILADDVKASHGATIGQPDQDEIFYLRSRGLSPVTALAMLTRGFADEIVAALCDPTVRALAERVVVGNLGR